MQPKKSLGNLSVTGTQPPIASSMRSYQQPAYPFGYQAPLELHQRKRSIALIPGQFSVAVKQHEEFLKLWQQRGKQDRLFSRTATLDCETDDDDEEEFDYPEVFLVDLNAIVSLAPTFPFNYLAIHVRW